MAPRAIGRVFLFWLTALLCSHLLVNGETNCGQLLPGITWMSRGVDIMTLDLFPSDLTSLNGYKHALFDFTCTQKRTWTHPTVRNYTYSLPDQIDAINTVPAGALNFKTSYYQTMNDYKTAMAAKVGVSVSFFIGSFSASVGYQEAKENIMKKSRSVLEVSAYVSALQIDFDAGQQMKLNHNFLNYINSRLPVHYEDDPQMYDTFIDTFGTHYFDSAKFGGYLYQKTIIENSYFYKADEKEIDANMEASFMGFASAKVDVHSSTKSVSEEFTKNSITHFYYYGGLADLSNHDNQVTKWVDTVNKDPWLFGGQLVPIENLIANATIRSQVKKAISVKMAKAFLKDFKDTLYIGGVVLPPTEAEKLSAIEHYLYNPADGLKNLEAVTSGIGDLFAKIQEIRDRALLRQYGKPFYQLWEDQLFGLNYYAANSCFTGQTRKTMEEKFNQFVILKEKFDTLLGWSQPDTEEVQELLHDAAKFSNKYPASGGICGGDSSCQSCINSVNVRSNYRKYLTKIKNKFSQFLLDESFDLNYNLTAQLCGTNDTLEGMEAKYKLSQSLLGKLSSTTTKALDVQQLIHESNRFIDQYKNGGRFCGDDNGCHRCAEEKIKLEKNWRIYLRYYSDILEQFIEQVDYDMKRNLTVQYCIKSQQLQVAAPWAAWNLKIRMDNLLSSSVTWRREVPQLITDVTLFVYTFSSDICDGDEQCHSCARDLENKKNNLAKYVQYYKDKVVNLWENGSMACKWSLAKYCAHHIAFDKFDNEDDKRRYLGGNFTALLKQPSQKAILHLASLVEQYHQLVRYHTSTQVDICSGDTQCQQCLEHNVDCWNSNADYLQDIANHHCKTPLEWQVVNYRAKKIDDQCSEIDLGQSQFETLWLVF